MKTGLIIKKAIFAGVVAALVSVSAFSEGYDPITGSSADKRMLDAQALVEKLYAEQEYERSLIIYQRELAPFGDKYAQYMVGFMNYRGQGVEANRPAALAWFRLAAERSDPPFIEARDALFNIMPLEEVVESNQIFVELWRQLSDSQLLLELVRQDLKILRARGSTRVPGSNASSISMVNVQDGNNDSAEYYRRVRTRMEARLSYLQSNVEIVDIELNDDSAVKQHLEQEIREQVAALDMR